MVSNVGHQEGHGVECVFNAWANYDVENFNVLLQGRRVVE